MHFKTAVLLSCVAFLLSSFMLQAQPILPGPTTAPQPFIPPPPPESPDKAIKEFVQALNGKKWQDASQRVMSGKPEAELKPVIEDLKAACGGWRLTVEDVQATHDEETDFADARIRLRLQDRIGNKIFHDERLSLRMQNKMWKILPLSVAEERNALWGDFDSDILKNLATCFFAPEFLLKAKSMECMNHLKQLGLAAMQFVQDFDEKYALKANIFADYLRPYFRNDEILICPAHPDATIGYSFNAKLQNVTLAQIQDPAKTVLFYEGQNEKLEFRHGTRTAVAFADGHVSLVSAEDAKNLRWTP
jgi:prepilin-type processing-associated H-X9-DG protein